MYKLPGIISDIDGVLVRGVTQIQNVECTIKKLLNYKSDQSIQIPFVCLTNGGGRLESEKASQLNKILNIEDYDNKLTDKNIILNFTPLRPLFSSFENQQILIDGCRDIIKIAQDCKLKNFVTVEEMKFLNQLQNKIEMNLFYEKIYPRFKNESLFKKFINNSLNFDKILILNDPINWETNFNIILTVVNFRHLSNLPSLQVYVVNNDLLFSGKHHTPRLAFGAYTACLQSLHYKLFNYYLDIKYYGKPSSSTMEYAQNHCQQNFSLPQQKISKYYMIGDNPQSDIQGANNIGWTSILVRSGVYQDDQLKNLSKQMIPSHIVNDFQEAIHLIFKLENLKFN